MIEENQTRVHICECQICKNGTDAATMRHHQHINLLMSRLTEPQRRWYAATLSEQANSPGDRQLSLITGLDEKTIRRGKAELVNELAGLPTGRQRRAGGGRLVAEKKIRN